METTVIRDPEDGGMGIFRLVAPFAAALLFGGFFCLILLGAGFRGRPFLLPIFALPIFAFAAVLLFTGVRMAKGLWIRSVFQPAEGEIPRKALRWGERVVFRFRRGLGRPLVVERLEARLILFEKVVYQAGTRTQTVTKEIRSVPLPTVEIPGGLPVPMLAAEWTIEIPREGPASFGPKSYQGAPTAWVEWRVEVRQIVAGFPDPVSTLPIPVAPEVLA